MSKCLFVANSDMLACGFMWSLCCLSFCGVYVAFCGNQLEVLSSLVFQVLRLLWRKSYTTLILFE